MERNERGVDPRIVREINQNRLFTLLRTRGASTITEIAREIQLSPATVKSVLDDLKGYGLIRETGEGSSTGGRKPRLYSLDLENNFVCGVDLHAHLCTTALIRIDGSIITATSRAPQSKTPEEVAGLIRDAFMELCREQDIPYSDILGIGISQPGIVGSDGKKIRFDVHHGWTEVPLGSLVQELVSPPVFLVEDANGKLSAEMEFGVIEETDNLLYVLIGSPGESGISGGMVVRGEIMHGSKGFAGEIGHMVIDPKGPRCYCGRRGCWEAVTNVFDLIKKIEHWYPNADLTEIDDFYTFLLDNHHSSRKVSDMLEWYVDMQAEGLANLIHILNPEKIIIGGKITLLGETFLDSIKEKIREKVMRPFIEDIDIRFSSIETESGILGAVSIVLQHAVALRQQQYKYQQRTRGIS